MDVLRGKILVTPLNSSLKAEDLLERVDVLGYYFSAYWCPPCRDFTPILKDFHEELRKQALPFDILFVSSDSSPYEMAAYMQESHGSWCAVPWADPLCKDLKNRYDVRGIPSLVVVKKDGRLVTKDGRGDVRRFGLRAFETWRK